MPHKNSANADIGVELMKAAPPVVVTSASMLSTFDVSKLLAWVTVGYVLLQAGYLIWKWRGEWKKRRSARQASCEAGE